MQDPTQDLSPATGRHIFWWQMLFFFAFFSLVAVDNTFTVLADRARMGHPLVLAEPMVWESSSVLVIWLLIPLMGWWLGKFPISRHAWWRSLPAHVLATVPFSILHTEGMVSLRKLAYWSSGYHYDFGPFWDNWLYEYRKDFLTYWMVLGALLGFSIYGLWLDAREAKPAALLVPDPAKPDSPLDKLMVRKLNRVFRTVYYAGQKTNHRAGLAAGNKWRFIRDIKEGDLGVVPTPANF